MMVRVAQNDKIFSCVRASMPLQAFYYSVCEALLFRFGRKVLVVHHVLVFARALGVIHCDVRIF